jgi:uncharacterized protein
MATHAAQSPLAPVPDMPASRVLDRSGTLDETALASLRAQVAAIEQDTRAQLAILVVPSTGGEAIEPYATRVFALWKPGRRVQDDGVLLLLAIDDRRMRIEVGQGLEGTIPDLAAARIIEQQMKPRLREQDVDGALRAALDALGQRLRDTPGGASASDDGAAAQDGGGKAPWRDLSVEAWGVLGMVLWSVALGCWRARRGLAWPLLAGLAAGGLGLAVFCVDRPPLLTGCVPVYVVAGLLGYGCGRSSWVRWGAASVVGVVGGLAALAWFVGADHFWWGFLWLLGGSGGLLFVAGLVMALRSVWRNGIGYASGAAAGRQHDSSSSRSDSSGDSGGSSSSSGSSGGGSSSGGGASGSW